MNLSKAKQRLLKCLGDAYTKKVIDLEPCLYRNFGDFDVEISGGYNRGPFHIYVWMTKPHLEIVERHMHLKQDFEAIKKLLDDIASRYQNPSPDNVNA